MDASATNARRSASPDTTEARIAKRSKVEESDSTDVPVVPAPAARESVIRVPVARENSTTKLSAVLKPPSVALPAIAVSLPQPVVAAEATVVEDNSEEMRVREQELARWSSAAIESVPKHTAAAPMSDDAIIRRKLMFEAGNPAASSHRGVKLLSGSIGLLTKYVRELRSEEEIETVSQRLQLYLRQEELTLTRLAVACESISKLDEKEARVPLDVQAALQDVEEQMDDQKRRLEESHKTEQLFAGYVESANRIRKLDSYEELLKTRDKLKAETKKLKEEKTRLDRQQEEKLPYLLVAKWALKNLRYGEGSSAGALRPTGTLAQQHHSKSTNKHRKSPKKSSKDSKV
ncbi:hypothetical protein BV898_04719 [Hypsibius exemplaris]|uniref:Uncharacterized protein n=1 Tax=Hypsibius exemplaris TaxID=2072580 RepID=A0A1W0X1P4_HYPEX|nr:hypothetical protein BV898_04719 [Hypsibius exemplaris]